MASTEIDFWFSMGSTYSFLTVSRLGGVEQSTGISIRWRPFNLGAILTEMNNWPFKDKPAKSAYMWRDIERRAALYGFTVHLPVPYPAKLVLLANKVAIVGMHEGWGPDFARVAYRRWFELKQEMGDEPNLSESLREIGQDPDRVLARANAEDTNAFIIQETQLARELGIFGSPTFVVGRELFWGDDRLTDAISWLHYGCIRPQ